VADTGETDTLERFRDGYRRFVLRVPPFNVVPLSIETLNTPKKALDLPEDLEERTATIGIVLTVPALLSAAAGSPALSICLLALAATMCASLLLLPVVLFRVKRAAAVQDTLAFLIHFLTSAEHANLEEAYRRASRSTTMKEFRIGWSRLVARQVSDVPSLLRWLAAELRVYAEQLHTALSSLAGEIRKPRPDLGRILDEVVVGLRVLGEYEQEVFASKLLLATTVAISVPFSAFLLLPPVLAVAGSSPNSSFAAVGVVSVCSIALAVLYAATHLPSSLSTLRRPPSERALGRICPSWSAPSRRHGVVALAALAFAVFHPMLAVAGALILTWYARLWRCAELYTETIRKEYYELPVMLREVASDVAMLMPLENSLRRPGAAPHLRNALVRGAVDKELPERTFLVVADVVLKLRNAGTALASALRTLQEYVSRLQDQRTLVAAKLEDARATVGYIFFMLPLTSMLSVVVFKKLGDVMQKVGGTGGELLGFNILELLFGSRVVPLQAFSAVAATVIAGMLLSLPLLVVCEDVVHRDLLFAKLKHVAMGMLLLGAGGLVLILL
jgi:hypothetical protein